MALWKVKQLRANAAWCDRGFNKDSDYYMEIIFILRLTC